MTVPQLSLEDVPKPWRSIVSFVLFCTFLVGLGAMARAAVASISRAEAGEVYEERAAKDRKLVLQKLDALCRATPQANCPLGSE